MRKRLSLLIVPIITLILEMLPYGAVCNFGVQNSNGDIVQKRELFSYFDLTPYGYANFAPLLTAILTCVVLLLLIVFCITNNRHIMTTVKTVVCICIVISLCPLLLGITYFTVVGVLITLSCITELILLFAIYRKDSSK